MYLTKIVSPVAADVVVMHRVRCRTMKRIEILANAVIIAVGIIVGGNTGFAWYYRLFPRPIPGPYKPDQRIGDTADLRLAQARRTLLLMIASQCHFCTESMGFYQRLAKVSRERHVALVGVAAEDVRANDSYLRSNGVIVDRVVSALANGLKPAGTPTLVLVRADGRVVNSWRGRLSPEREREVVRALSAD